MKLPAEIMEALYNHEQQYHPRMCYIPIFKGMDEQERNFIEGSLRGVFHHRQPIRYAKKLADPISFAASTSGYLIQHEFVGIYNYCLVYCEALFAAAANADVVLEVRASLPGTSTESSEAYDRFVFAYNTSSPYYRRGWIKVDTRFLDDISLYVSNSNSGSATVMGPLYIVKVV